MRKSIKVTVVFKFNGVDGIDSDDADKILQEMTDATEDWQIEHGADAVWIDDAVEVIEQGRSELEVWDEAWIKELGTNSTP